MTETGDRISRLCEAMGDTTTWTDCQEAGASEILQQIVTAIREGTLAHCPEDRAEEELTSALNALDTAMAAAGYGYLTRPDRNYRQLPGQDRTRQVDLWVCPAPRPCTRTVRARDADGEACSITGQVLKKIRLSS